MSSTVSANLDGLQDQGHELSIPLPARHPCIASGMAQSLADRPLDHGQIILMSPARREDPRRRLSVRVFVRRHRARAP